MIESETTYTITIEDVNGDVQEVIVSPVELWKLLSELKKVEAEVEIKL